ncbi:unnamed protein product [Penicillium crustosum]
MTGNHILYTVPEYRIAQSNNVYSITSPMFFIKYTIFQIPIAVIIGKVCLNSFSRVLCFPEGPSSFFVLDRKSMAGLFPGNFSLSNIWYPRHKLQKQNTSFTKLNALPRTLAAWPTG